MLLLKMTDILKILSFSFLKLASLSIGEIKKYFSIVRLKIYCFSKKDAVDGAFLSNSLILKRVSCFEDIRYVFRLQNSKYYNDLMKLLKHKYYLMF